LILGTAATFAGLAAATHFVHEYQVGRNSKAVFERAQAARDRGDNQKAIRLFTEFIGLSPRDSSGALAEMAVLLAETGRSSADFSRAFAALEEVLRRDQNRQDLRRLAATLAMKLGRYQAAKSHWSKLGDTADGETAFLGGRILRALGDYRGAARLYSKAVARSRENIDYYLELISLVTHRAADVPLQEVDPLQLEPSDPRVVVDRLLGAMVENGKPVSRAFHARAADRKQRGRLDDAFEDVNRALDELENGDSLMLAAEISLAKGDAAVIEGRPADAGAFQQAARDLAERGLRLAPPDSRLFLTLAQIDKRRGLADEAEQHLRNGLSQIRALAKDDQRARLSDVEIQLRWSLADLLIDQAQSHTGEVADAAGREARDLITQLRKGGVVPPLVDFLEAKNQLNQRQWGAARARLEGARPHLANLPDLTRQIDLLLGRCCDKLGNPDAKVEVFRRALAADPLWTTGRMQLASALVGVQRFDEAIAEYRALSTSAVEAPLAAARLLVIQNLARPEGQRQWADVESELDLADRMRPGNSDSLIVRAGMLIAQKKFPDAQQALESAIQNKPQDVALLAALSNLWLVRDDFPESTRLENARTTIAKAGPALDEYIELRFARVLLARLGPRHEAPHILADLIKDLGRFSDTDRSSLLQDVARAYAGIGMPGQALEICRQLSRDYQDDLLSRLTVVEIAAQEADEKTIAECLPEIRRIEGANGPNGDFVEASLLVQRATRDRTFISDLGRAGILLREAAKGRPNWAAVPQMQGALEDLVGNTEDALSHFRKAIELGDNSPRVVGQLVSHLYEQKRYDEADQRLQQATNEDPGKLTGNLARLASNVAWERRDFDTALRLADEVAGTSSDFRDLIRLSRLRFARGTRGAPVEKPLRAAIELAPAEPEPHVALVSLLARTGRTRDAETAIQQAEQALPDDIRDLTAAKCYEFLNAREKARDAYLQALQVGPRDLRALVGASDFFIRNGETRKAEELLAVILDSETNAPETAIALARRRLALIVAFRGGYDNTVQGMEMLDRAKLRNQTFSVDDLRVKAAILSRRNTRQDRRNLIQTLTEIGARQPLTRAEQFEMARLYETIDDWPHARELLQDLLREGRTNSLLVAHYVQSLVRHDELDEAQSWITELEILLPKSFAVTALKARILAARGQNQQAAQLVQTFIHDELVTSPKAISSELMARGNTEEALALLTAFTDSREDAVVPAALNEARRLLTDGDAEGATTILESYIRTEMAEANLQRTVITMAAALLTEVGYPSIAESVLREHLKTLDSNGRLALVTLMSQHGRLDEALRLCEEAESVVPAFLVGQMTVTALRTGTPTSQQIERVKLRFRTWLRKEPDSTVILNYLANLSDLQQNYDEAEATYFEVLKRDPQDVVALNNLAYLTAVRRGKGAEGLQLINRAIQVVGPVANLLDTRAAIYLVLNEPQLAMRDLNSALEEKPDASVYIRLAQAQLSANNRRRAREAIARAKDLVPKASNVHALDLKSFRALSQQLK
jgi:tetratricopeptide (TPR) repeat protein